MDQLRAQLDTAQGPRQRHSRSLRTSWMTMVRERNEWKRCWARTSSEDGPSKQTTKRVRFSLVSTWTYAAKHMQSTIPDCTSSNFPFINHSWKEIIFFYVRQWSASYSQSGSTIR
ncbi:hypothetical protein RB195_010627 [Necator americanus]|uniref:Uncharacterized protein n=1 Tax=Necator americanus TaxID=51031 RepID=A0ABR1CYR5_NECAM